MGELPPIKITIGWDNRVIPRIIRNLAAILRLKPLTITIGWTQFMAYLPAELQRVIAHWYADHPNLTSSDE